MPTHFVQFILLDHFLEINRFHTKLIISRKWIGFLVIGEPFFSRVTTKLGCVLLCDWFQSNGVTIKNQWPQPNDSRDGILRASRGANWRSHPGCAGADILLGFLLLPTIPHEPQDGHREQDAQETNHIAPLALRTASAHQRHRIVRRSVWRQHRPCQKNAHREHFRQLRNRLQSTRNGCIQWVQQRVWTKSSARIGSDPVESAEQFGPGESVHCFRQCF